VCCGRQTTLHVVDRTNPTHYDLDIYFFGTNDTDRPCTASAVGCGWPVGRASMIRTFRNLSTTENDEGWTRRISDATMGMKDEG